MIYQKKRIKKLLKVNKKLINKKFFLKVINNQTVKLRISPKIVYKAINKIWENSNHKVKMIAMVISNMTL